ncbi:thermonuclease family protein [Peptoniphilus timonensis]|uniref:thermonuclease family protein n=1 Tax=Peptoniphilus timonensis TaxID=1268254 RepID=UPI00031D0D7B|nr:thermonuclease family protein [Peptoniphilus timonensis]
MPIQKDYYLVNGEKISTEISGEIKNDRTFVPVRLIAELFGRDVKWDNNTKKVLINDKNQESTIKANNTFEKAKVLRVIDGDTIEIDRGNGKEKVRFILVDTPETVHPKKGVQFFGKEASNFTKSNLTGKTIYLQKDISETDRYGRLLRYIWTERPSSDNPSNDEIRAKCFNAILLSGGYANVATFPPDIKYVDLFRNIEKEARDNGAGLWSGNSENNNIVEIDNPKNNNVEMNNTIVNGNPKDKAYKYSNGRIIGNKNSHIFHVPSGRDYKKVSLKNAVFFDSPSEAISAGYRQAKN